MPATAKSQLDELRKASRRAAARLLQSKILDTPPISLNALGKQENIAALRFMPILGSAGLLQTKAGFDIVINTEAPGAIQKADTVLSVEESDWNSLAAPLRFTIAHEIAHAVVLRVSGGNPNKDIFFRNEDAIDHFCNDLASGFLMPAQQVEDDIGQRLFDAAYLAQLSRRFLVSAEAFVRRVASLELANLSGSADGLVSIVRNVSSNDRSARMRFVAGKLWGARALNQFGLGPAEDVQGRRDTKFPLHRFVDKIELGDNSDAWLRANAYGVRMITAQWRGSGTRNVLEYEAQYQRISENPLTLILAVRVLAGPSPPP